MTKKVMFSIFLFGVSCCSFSQKVTDSLLCTFYNQTLYDYLGDTNITKWQKENKNIFIETDFDTNCLIKKVKKMNLCYLPLGEESEYDKHFKGLKKGQSRIIYHIRHKAISIDTIDILISNFGAEKQKDGEYVIIISDDGILGYVPQGRFIYDKKEALWNFIPYMVLLNEEEQRLDRLFEKLK